MPKAHVDTNHTEAQMTSPTGVSNNADFLKKPKFVPGELSTQMKHTIMNVGYVILNELKQANLADEEENSLNAILHPPNVEGTEKIVEDDKENEEVEVAQEESIEEDAKLEKEPGETKDEDGQADEEKKESTEENGTEVEEKKEEPQEIAKVPDVIQKVLLPQKILTRDQLHYVSKTFKTIASEKVKRTKIVQTTGFSADTKLVYKALGDPVTKQDELLSLGYAKTDGPQDSMLKKRDTKIELANTTAAKNTNQEITDVKEIRLESSKKRNGRFHNGFQIIKAQIRESQDRVDGVKGGSSFVQTHQRLVALKTEQMMSNARPTTTDRNQSQMIKNVEPNNFTTSLLPNSLAGRQDEVKITVLNPTNSVQQTVSKLTVNTKMSSGLAIPTSKASGALSPSGLRNISGAVSPGLNRISMLSNSHPATPINVNDEVKFSIPGWVCRLAKAQEKQVNFKEEEPEINLPQINILGTMLEESESKTSVGSARTKTAKKKAYSSAPVARKAGDFTLDYEKKTHFLALFERYKLQKESGHSTPSRADMSRSKSAGLKSKPGTTNKTKSSQNIQVKAEKNLQKQNISAMIENRTIQLPGIEPITIHSTDFDNVLTRLRDNFYATRDDLSTELEKSLSELEKNRVKYYQYSWRAFTAITNPNNSSLVNQNKTKHATPQGWESDQKRLHQIVKQLKDAERMKVYDELFRVLLDGPGGGNTTKEKEGNNATAPSGVMSRKTTMGASALNGKITLATSKKQNGTSSGVSVNSKKIADKPVEKTSENSSIQIPVEPVAEDPERILLKKVRGLIERNIQLNAESFTNVLKSVSLADFNRDKMQRIFRYLKNNMFNLTEREYMEILSKTGYSSGANGAPAAPGVNNNQMKKNVSIEAK